MFKYRMLTYIIYMCNALFKNIVTYFCILQNTTETTLLETFDQPTVNPVWMQRNVNIPIQSDVFHIIIQGRVTGGKVVNVAIDDISVRPRNC